MTTINISVDPMDPKKVQEAIAVLQKFTTTEVATATPPAPKQAKAAKPTPETTPIVVDGETVQATGDTNVPATQAPKSVPPTSPGINLKDLRDLLSTKVKEHRATIKAKLTELGVENIPTLPEEQYPAFRDFLNTLS